MTLGGPSNLVGGAGGGGVKEDGPPALGFWAQILVPDWHLHESTGFRACVGGLAGVGCGVRRRGVGGGGAVPRGVAHD